MRLYKRDLRVRQYRARMGYILPQIQPHHPPLPGFNPHPPTSPHSPYVALGEQPSILVNDIVLVVILQHRADLKGYQQVERVYETWSGRGEERGSSRWSVNIMPRAGSSQVECVHEACRKFLAATRIAHCHENAHCPKTRSPPNQPLIAKNGCSLPSELLTAMNFHTAPEPARHHSTACCLVRLLIL